MMKGWQDQSCLDREFGMMPPGCRVVRTEGHVPFQRTQLRTVWVMEKGYRSRELRTGCLSSKVKKKGAETPAETQREVTESAVV